MSAMSAMSATGKTKHTIHQGTGIAPLANNANEQAAADATSSSYVQNWKIENVVNCVSLY